MQRRRKGRIAIGFPVTTSYPSILRQTAFLLYKKTKIAVGDVKLSLRKSRKNRVGADGKLFRAKKREFSEILQQADNQLFTTYHISTDIPPSCNNACFSP